jgi:hypothetical protein
MSAMSMACPAGSLSTIRPTTELNSFHACIEESTHVRGRDFRLNVVHGGQNVPAAAAHLSNPPPTFLSHIVDAAPWHYVSRVDSAPKAEVPAELGLEPGRIHVRRRDLNRIQPFDAQLDEVRDERIDRSAAMMDQFRRCGLAEMPPDAGEVRLEQPPEAVR